MALNIRSLVRFASVPFISGTSTAKCNVYNYASPDALSSIIGAGYFNNLRDTLKVGDIIIAVAEVGASGELAMLKVTAAPTSGDVTTAAAGPSALVGGLTAIASLTDSSGGTADDTIAAIGGTYSQTEVRNAVADLAAKINAILARLRSAGIIET